MKIRGLLIIIALSFVYLSTGCTSVRQCGTSCGPLGCGQSMPVQQVSTTGCSDCTDGCSSCATSCGKSCGPNFDVCLPRFSLCDIPARIRNGITCKAGCSDEVYWGEWFYDPPECSPCDCNGNWTGRNPNEICRPGLLGVRYGQSGCDSCGGCSSCSGEASSIEYHSSPEAGKTSTYYTEPPAWEGTVSAPTPAGIEQELSYPTSTRSSTRRPHTLGRGSH